MTGEHRAHQMQAAAPSFDRLRVYQPGDDVRHLDPAATARTGQPYGMHSPERLITTWIVLDVSPSMAFGTADRLKADVAEGGGRPGATRHQARRQGGAAHLRRRARPDGAAARRPRASVGLERLLEEG